MADIKIRRLEDWVVATHRSRAEASGRSLEEELRIIVMEAALRPQRDFARKAAEFKRQLRAKHGDLSDSTPPIREDRETRG